MLDWGGGSVYKVLLFTSLKFNAQHSKEKKKKPSLVVLAYNPRLGKERQVDLWRSLAWQPSLLGKFQAHERHCPPNQDGWC